MTDHLTAEDVPGVVPACAGRSNAAHERTPMTPSGWRCPVCGEIESVLAEGSDVLRLSKESSANVETVDIAALALEYARKVEAGTATTIEVATLVCHLVVLNEDLPDLLGVPASVFAEGSDVLPTQRDH